MILGHIGVRKGSKGVPNKNFRMICGKPLIDWSLDMLLAHPRVDAVVVSTDSQAIYDHAVAKGTLPIGLRPAHLATDTAGKWGVWQHALAASEALCGPTDVFLDLDCTSPLRARQDIDNALDLFHVEQPDMVMSCCEARKNPYFNLVEPDEEGA
ncbi:MAG: acylneuraminate cytidylyltransferase family protein, partial [Paracoccaceae bacterium]